MISLNNATINVLSAISITDRALHIATDWTITTAVTTLFTTVDLSDRTINALETHWTNHGTTYKYWAKVAALTVLSAIGLVLMFLKAQMGEEGAYEELVEVVEALDRIAKEMAVSAWTFLKELTLQVIDEIIEGYYDWFYEQLFNGANYWIYRKVQ